MPSFSDIIVRSTIGLAIFGFAFVKAGIDLTPTVGEYTAEGVKFQQLAFRDDKERIEYELPRGWSFDGSAAELHLKPVGKNFAEAVIQAAPLSKPQLLDESARSALKEKTLVDLPAGSQFAKIEQEKESPLLLNGQATFELIVSYQLMGEKFSRSILFANRPNAQWSFRLTAKKADFDSLQTELRRSILSWHWFPADEGAQHAATAPTAAPTH
jgi:hypothetical protein